MSFEEGSELRVICRSEDQGGNSFENPGSEWWCCELVNSGKQGLGNEFRTINNKLKLFFSAKKLSFIISEKEASRQVY